MADALRPEQPEPSAPILASPPPGEPIRPETGWKAEHLQKMLDSGTARSPPMLFGSTDASIVSSSFGA